MLLLFCGILKPLSKMNNITVGLEYHKHNSPFSQNYFRGRIGGVPNVLPPIIPNGAIQRKFPLCRIVFRKTLLESLVVLRILQTCN